MQKIERFSAVLGLMGLLAASSPPAQAQTFEVLYNFTGFADGGYPQGGVVGDSAGNIYGTASSGGSTLNGTLFEVDPTGKFAVVFTFDYEDGQMPYGDLLLNSTGDLYGTTAYGGTAGGGTVFEVNALGLLKVLYNFTGGTDGGSPHSGLIADAVGNLYGTTSGGGDLSCSAGVGCGTVFKVNKIGKEAVLYSFAGGAAGDSPEAGLVADAAGNLYGTTLQGGDLSCGSGRGCGTVFKVNKSGKETVLYSFTGAADGGYPEAGLVADAAGNLYGTTNTGGDLSCNSGVGCGTAFKMDKLGTETVLHSFAGGTDGASPIAGLIMDAAGNLVGTTAEGGTYNSGTIFKVSTSGTETVLHSFNGQSGGLYPEGALFRDSAGNIYGTTNGGGVYLQGIVFKLRP